MPVYSADTHLLIGAHVSYKDDLPNFFHEMTHAKVLESYDSDLLNYYCPTPCIIAPEFGSGPIVGAPVNTVSLTESNQGNRRRALYNNHNKTILESNLISLKNIVNKADFSNTDNIFMSPENKHLLKAPLTTPLDMEKYSSTFNAMQSKGLIQASNKFMKKKSINKINLVAEQLRKKTWVEERINYAFCGMGGLGDVHFEYDTVINQILLQVYLWGYHDDHELFVAVGKLARESYERRESAQISKPPAIIAPRIVPLI